MAEQRILLVDDQPKALAMYGKVLEKGGFAVTAAESGREALQKMKDEPIDLVLADVVMPRIDGLEILKQVGREYPGVPMILMVGGLTNEIVLEAAEFGAAQRGKPVKPGILLRSVRQALRARRESTGHLRKSGSDAIAGSRSHRNSGKKPARANVGSAVERQGGIYHQA